MATQKDPSQGKLTVEELKELFKDKKGSTKLPGGYTLSFALPSNHFDEVYPGLLLGDRNLALDLKELQAHKVTHVLNTAQGEKFAHVNTNAEFYKDSGIAYHGIRAVDTAGYNLSGHFTECAKFIDTALVTGGRVYVHCHQGLSRSSTITIAFLMMKRNMDAREAATVVRSNRAVLPNDGFLKQLCDLNEKLYPQS